MADKPATRSISFSFTLDVPGILRTIGIVLVVLKVLGLGGLSWFQAVLPFVILLVWTLAFHWLWKPLLLGCVARHMARRVKAFDPK